MALGVGATITVFTVVNATLVRPLPFAGAGELHHVAKISPGGTEKWLSVPELNRWRDENHGGVALAGFTPMDFNIRGANPEGLTVVWASRGFLPVLRVAPQLGRGFSGTDFSPESGRTALVSHELWQRRYGGDPAVIGSHVDLEGPGFLSDSSGRYTIVGVLPETFWLFYTRTDFVIPMRASARQLNDPSFNIVATVIARLPGTRPEVLRADLGAIARRFADARPASERLAYSITVRPLQDWHFGELRRPLLFLLATATLVAMTACLNVALLLMARTGYRQRELAVRLAIGADRTRVARQLMTESIVLSLLGGLLGLFLARGVTGIVKSLIPGNVISRIPGGLDALTLDNQVTLAALAASLLTGLIAGIGSLVTFRPAGLFEHLRATAIAKLPGGRETLRAGLVVGQTAVAVVLVIAGGLFLRSLGRLNDVNVGITPRPGLVVWLNLNLTRYPAPDDRVRFYRDVFDRLDAQAEVTHASGVDMPFHLEWQTTRFDTTAGTGAAPGAWPEALARAVTPTYFERHGIRLVQGRGFTTGDAARSEAVAIVSQTLAARSWPGRSAIGQELRTSPESGPATTSTVVGVVADIRSAPHAQPKPIVYRPYLQAPPPWMYITVEGVNEQAKLLPAIRRAVWAVDPDQPVDGSSGPWTLQEWVSERMEQPRQLAVIGNALGAVALLLAAIGLYGVVSYTVTRRTAEFGVRMALGATAGSVMRLVLRRTLALTGAGIALGLVAASLMARSIASLLFGVSPLDFVVFAGAPVLFLAVCVAASIAPVRRAMRVDPVVALRAE